MLLSERRRGDRAVSGNMAGTARRGELWLVEDWRGTASQAWSGMSRTGADRRGESGIGFAGLSENGRVSDPRGPGVSGDKAVSAPFVRVRLGGVRQRRVCLGRLGTAEIVSAPSGTSLLGAAGKSTVRA
jgi:hypothetical protein